MKEFKGQVIDTPGVIDRVSTLFRGHPSLIQGFNTFLPPGYRIECFGGEGDASGLITVTTPAGTVSQIPGNFAAAIDQREREAREGIQASTAEATARDSRAGSSAPYPSATSQGAAPAQPLPPLNALPSHIPSGPPPFQGTSHTGRQATAPPPARQAPANQGPGTLPLPPHAQHPLPPSGPSTPSAAQFLASGGLSHGAQPAPQPQQGGNRAPILEFNHAITFVNKIKTRFNNDPETYKQFLEILQTYQRDTRDIAEVYEQVTKLFTNAPDLLDEFKQFLPENGTGGLGMLSGSFMQAAGAAPAVPEKVAGQKRGVAKEGKEMGQKKRRTAASGVEPATKSTQGKRARAGQRESPIEDVEPGLSVLTPQQQTLASPDEVAFFDKVKKFIDDKVVYHEFLKLINLFVQDMIDTKTLLDRAQLFIGDAPEVWATFQRVVGVDSEGRIPPNPASIQGGYGFGGMIGIDNLMVENTPMLDRVKPDMNLASANQVGPSYRQLPRSEINLQCTGRDAMCWEVLNDEWVAHPTWNAEDVAPFVSHRKNQFEDNLHKSEEERHEYDYHIEANLRTIALLEPLNNKIQTMEPEERANFNLKAGLGGQSKSIYQRIIKKVYGKELGPDVIRALHDNPVVALPIVLERLKAKDEEWKRAQREWNRLWREQDAKNFYKALDYQHSGTKATDKKKVAPAKTLINEIEARKAEQLNQRSALVDFRVWRAKPQMEFEFTDMDVLKDSMKLIISYLDRMQSNSLSSADQVKVEHFLRDFVPILFMLDKDEFDAEFGDGGEPNKTPEEESEDSDGDEESDSVADDAEVSSNAGGGSARGGKGEKRHAADLRKRLLKQAAGDNVSRELSVTTTGPTEDGQLQPSTEPLSGEVTPLTENGERADTPLPVPADPEEVAEAVEKDKAGAEASEQTWVKIDGVSTESQPLSGRSSVNGEKEKEQSVKAKRKGNFFANSHFYVLSRYIQMLYSRLMTCKTIASKLANENRRPVNPLALKLGLVDPVTQYFGILQGDNPAEHYYSHLLSLLERYFDNEIEFGAFEDALRLMFTNEAYLMFNLDKVIGGIVRQIQTIVGDLKSQELFALLQRDRANARTSTKNQIAYRMQAEGVLGGNENLYKIEWLPGKETLTIQLLSEDDRSVDDAETTQERWAQYIESFALTHPTEGLLKRVDSPFLRRNITKIHSREEELSASAGPSSSAKNNVEAKDGLEIKIALGNYRMFFTPGTEDYFHRAYKHEERVKPRSRKAVDAPAPAPESAPASAPESAPAPAPAPAPAAEVQENGGESADAGAGAGADANTNADAGVESSTVVPEPPVATTAE
ncbi:paired amphipathic helix protein Sin3a [Cryptococcus neoformans Tu259-1]|uniref:Paired amphipathic helix protein Sin3a n=1 Tax=Cryptococcus neoformans Tu259-1 TaxID=1230072 RepID=A0A854QHU3_CRYNE|nr:paired amphipathic helix protein Sin3a [Cryptococcus neoformans var. grubii Tu259-1]